ncbi:LysR family transcriptional regulator [Hydrogenophaga sp.]|uniref:LysR family transcriptional regulator n=1 Tax=Hydrogenophaga sp. TaxID=1904254 RepID=UPI002727EB19|nr:LysR family transcriptional regulator [Hydrogenophaga sp.]MDO9437195.1 LysR family transcriptional regulator [Hydrogenophaga sp.]
MHIKDIDLNLLRLFNAVYTAGSVSRAAEQLGLTQPAVSQGLTRLRLLIKDPLFVRAPGGVKPTPKAVVLAEAVQQALDTLSQALNASRDFDPASSRRLFRLHMSDIGESRFLPDLMASLYTLAPGVRVASRPVVHSALADALDSGVIDFAFGFLPQVKDTQRSELLRDRYVVLMRAGHPLYAALQRTRGNALLRALQQLDFVAVRSHSDTLRILAQTGLQERLRLTTEHFMVLPSIVSATDLCVVMPGNIARGFVDDGGCVTVQPPFKDRDFTVSLHWSHRFESDPDNRWFREQVLQLFRER